MDHNEENDECFKKRRDIGSLHYNGRCNEFFCSEDCLTRNIFPVSKWLSSDILPVNEKSAAETREFLNNVISICLDFIVKSSDRKEKVLDFHQPSELWNLYDFKIPSDPMNLDQLLKDCSECLKYQVKTGEWFKIYQFYVCLSSSFQMHLFFQLWFWWRQWLNYLTITGQRYI